MHEIPAILATESKLPLWRSTFRGRRESNMDTLEHVPQEHNSYFIDHESAGEMARLLDQDRLYTEAMGGFFSERSDLSDLHRMLDIGCGPGGWVQELAFAFPDKEFVGTDISEAMIKYARAQAKV